MIKALSLSRPWTTLILDAVKPIENRSWTTRYRGPLVVHGAKSWDGDSVSKMIERVVIPGRVVHYETSDHPTGFLGVVDLIGICTAARDVSGRPSCGCGPWAFGGAVHWRVENARRFPEPIPGPGRMGLFVPSAEVFAAVLAAMKEVGVDGI